MTSLSCKRCGGTDHVRASSAKCPNRILSQKRRFTATNRNVSTFTIRESFGKFCNDAHIRTKIHKDVFEVSSLAVEASIYVHFHYTKLLHSGEQSVFKKPFTQNHLLDFYYHLQGKRQRLERVPLDEEYFVLRKKHGLEKVYDGRYRCFVIQSIAVQHETAMKNCICVHLYDRLVRYVYLKHERKTPKWVWKCRVYEELFSKDIFTPRSAEIVDLLRIFDLPTDWRGFTNAEKNWWRLVPFSHRLAMWFVQHGFKSFAIFPVFSTGPKHLRYNAMGLYELLRSSKPLEFKISADDFRASTPSYWWRYFNLSKKRYGQLDPFTHKIIPYRDKTKYGMSFTTNGAYCCVAMERFSDEAPEPKRKNKKIINENHVELSKYKGFLGLDPGVVNYVGACYMSSDSDFSSKCNYILKNSKFKQEDCKERVIRMRRKQIIGSYENALFAYRQCHQKMSSRCCSDYEESLAYTVYRLFHHEGSHLKYSRRKLVKLSWYAKTLKRSGEDRLVEDLLNLSKTKSPVLVCFGDGSLKNNTSYGGNVKPAVCSLRRAFHRRRDRCHVADTDEYMTTQCCSKCTERMELPPKHEKRTKDDDDRPPRRRHDHRFQFCQKCGITWNRDVNAARNIALVALGLVDYRRKYNNKNVNNFVNVGREVVRPTDAFV